MRFIIIVFFSYVSVGSAGSVPSNSIGVSWGLLSHCPGSNKTTIITKKSLNHLTLSVQGAGLPFIANRTTYTYYQMRKLAKDPKIDFLRRTVVYVGGYMSHPNMILTRLLGKIYNDLDYNVLLLDTNRFTTYWYPLAARHMRAVGKHTAEMLATLVQEGLDPNKLDLVGISLGAHTCGFIGKQFFNVTGTKISRITGLDPAGPCFRHATPDQRLDWNDAQFVDVVYTNAEGYGMSVPMGHVNFYVNGGEFQPGDVIFMICNVLCSHIRVFTLWISSLINRKEFVGIKCDSVQEARNHECYNTKPLVTNVLGVNVDRSNTGIFYLATDNNYPYYLGSKGVKKESNFWDSHLGWYNQEDVVSIR